MNYEIVRGSLTNRGTVKPRAEIALTPTSEEFYLSLFGFDNSIYEHLQLNHTVSGFAGSYFCEFLYFDLDRNGDLWGVLESARDLLRRLHQRFQLSPKQVYLSFSGSKGVHIGFHQSLFGGFAPSPQLPQQIQVLAARLLAECHDLTLDEMQARHVEAKKAGGNFADADLGIYNPNRLFRVINSLNKKSGRYKVGLTSEELFNLPLTEIEALAAQPRTDYKPETKLTAQVAIPELAALWEYARTFDVAAFTKSTTGKGSTIDRDFFAPPQTGNRNNELFKQACHLFDHSDLYETHVLQLVSLINDASGVPLPNDEVRTLVKSAFKRTQQGKAQAKASVLGTQPAATDKVEIWSDWTEEWLEYYTQAPSPMTCLLPEIDEDQEHNLKGKLAVFIGSGGTRKSYFLQNVITHNVLGYGQRVLYSSMEMGKPETVNRFLDMYFEPEEGLAASKRLQRYARENKDDTREMLRLGSQTINDQLILTSVGGKTTQDYERDIQNTIRLYGSLDILAIDGLSVMGGKAKDETERFNLITLELKELAKRYNLFIMLICHTTKACAAHTRDARPFVRGSEKILDNSDFSISFANIIDAVRSTPENIQYASHLAHIKYYNKRGSGKMLNQLLQFDGLRKSFSASPAPLLEYPDYDTFVREHNRQARKAEAQGKANNDAY
ncbi:primase C-terminal domain-containing protein [Hymenobacter profundi]|uniref:Primase C-terminal domain-containing protein n=1 Tax=Hymenobacter profundi TaxID=1982110 RepID=A0ABS6WZ65_9BACT|nr:primase C-terminal domain-containing protein [Hymenobacter profundi]MBW3128856.1 primase C-terminal domain-containing protein [Hymenobacter profundi]